MIRYLKRLNSSTFVRVKVFPMYGGIGMSAPSLHRDSLIWVSSLHPTSFFTLRGMVQQLHCLLPALNDRIVHNYYTCALKELQMYRACSSLVHTMHVHVVYVCMYVSAL